ncbi:hypothetical protein L5515_010278 [Caenorhabditis briggsae]|uniref:DUF19 domain-containing protein n=1 Tax=Caenorhabditis briggsae TaxID=6238 RepID=A0AAE9EQR5_CAEBR|nr:hypothetical protein L3Y34_003124 [Caenorhabditis briggsae]UMM26677.1 hypothetical protein L5515_010278 [Caenorhabditis briggsae]
MRAIFLLISLISLVESAPTVSDCKYEIFEAKMCWQLMPARKWNIVPKEEFAAKKSKFQNFLTCLGEPKCELTQNWLKLKKSIMDRTEGMCESYGCLGNGTFQKIEYKCQNAEKFISYTEQNYANCLTENIRKAPKCSSTDLEAFQKVVKFNEDVFKTQDLYIENLKKLRTNIRGCLLDIAYERHEHKCQNEENNIDRAEPEFMNCMIRRIENAEKCTDTDLKKLKDVLQMVEALKKKIGHNEQYKRIESEKDDEYLVDF